MPANFLDLSTLPTRIMIEELESRGVAEVFMGDDHFIYNNINKKPITVLVLSDVGELPGTSEHEGE